MSSYVEKVLINGEQLLHIGRISWWSLAGKLSAGLLLLVSGFAATGIYGPLWLAVAVAGSVFLLMAWVEHRTTELAITSKRIIVKRGLVRRDTIEINLVKVESLQVEQGLIGRLLNFGDIIVSAGGGPMAPVVNIAAPLEFRRRFTEATDVLQARG